jgi:secreted trypsin-like serine protease
MHILLLSIWISLFSHSSFAIQGGQEADPRAALTATAISLGDLSSGSLVRSYCSGVIVSEHTIVTAAHCLTGKDPAQIVVLFGFNGNMTSVMRLGQEIHIPVEYQAYNQSLPDTLDHYDIGVLRFEGDLPPGFQPATLISQELNATEIGQNFTVAGFGLPKTGVLFLCDVKLLNPDYARSEFELSASTTCSPASGDSGGPVFRASGNTISLYGLHNWGWHDGAGNPSMSVEVKISFYVPWILSLSR